MFYYDIEDWEFKVANGRDSVRESSPIMTTKARFFFSKAVNSMQFTTFTHLSKVPRVNTVVIKSHSTDEMKTVRRKRQNRGGGRKKKKRNRFGSYISTLCSAHDTNYFSFSFLRCTATIFHWWTVFPCRLWLFHHATSTEGKSATRKHDRAISCCHKTFRNHKFISLLIQRK